MPNRGISHNAHAMNHRPNATGSRAPKDVLPGPKGEVVVRKIQGETVGVQD